MNDWLTDFLVPVDYTIGNVPKDSVKRSNRRRGSYKIHLKNTSNIPRRTITTHPAQYSSWGFRDRMLLQLAKGQAKISV